MLPTDPTPATSEARLAQVAAVVADYHYMVDEHTPEERHLYCATCWSRWPCDTVDFFQELDAALAGSATAQ